MLSSGVAKKADLPALLRHRISDENDRRGVK
jgi:hypothetical protein